MHNLMVMVTMMMVTMAMQVVLIRGLSENRGKRIDQTWTDDSDGDNMITNDNIDNNCFDGDFEDERLDQIATCGAPPGTDITEPATTEAMISVNDVFDGKAVMLTKHQAYVDLRNHILALRGDKLHARGRHCIRECQDRW